MGSIGKPGEKRKRESPGGWWRGNGPGLSLRGMGHAACTYLSIDTIGREPDI